MRPKIKKENKSVRLTINLSSFIIDTSPDISFDIIYYLDLKIPTEIKRICNPQTQLPVYCNCECSLYSGDLLVTSKFILPKTPMVCKKIELPQMQGQSQQTRIQYQFLWTDPIQFDVFIDDLPRDTIAVFKFYVSCYKTAKKLIGVTTFTLFQQLQTGSCLRLGNFTLLFGSYKPTDFQLYSYTFPFKALHTTFDHLHPADAESYIRSVSFEGEKLSDVSQFAKLQINGYQKPQPSDSYVPVVQDEFSPNFIFPFSPTYKSVRFNAFRDYSLIYPFTIKNNVIGDMWPPTKYSSAFVPDIVHRIVDNFEITQYNELLLHFILREKRPTAQNLKITPVLALELLMRNEKGDSFYVPEADQIARRSLIEAPSDHIMGYIPQLVALYSPSNCVFDVLLHHSKSYFSFASRLRWYLETIEHDDPAKELSIMLFINPDDSEMRKKLEYLGKERQLVNSIFKVMGPHSEKETRKERCTLQAFQTAFESVKGAPLPTYPEVAATEIKKVKVFSGSNTKPVLIVFGCSDGIERGIVFKTGDDMRQDMLVELLMKEMVSILDEKIEKQDFLTYSVIQFSIGKNKVRGCCEFVERTKTLTEINKEKDGLESVIQTDSQRFKYTHSLAANVVISYILGIADRHTENILIRDDGTLVHVDFGYVFGHEPGGKFRVEVKLNKNMLSGVRNTYQEALQELLRQSKIIFKVLRENARRFFILVDSLHNSTVECFIPSKCKEYRCYPMKKICDSLRLDKDMTTAEAVNDFCSFLQGASTSQGQNINDFVHLIAQALK